MIYLNVKTKINKEVKVITNFYNQAKQNRKPFSSEKSIQQNFKSLQSLQLMKPSKRMNTNQTNHSNKKSNQLPQDNTSFQLPKIQKTSNYETNSNLSYDLDFNDEKEGRYELDEIEENQKEQFGVVNYERMTMEEIKIEYQRLREEVATLSSQIKKKSQLLQSKIMKKQTNRSSNPLQTQRKLAHTEQQVYENNQLLNRLRQEYQQLQKRSNLANSSISRPNAEMNEKILSLREKILTTKEKIKVLKRKTKKTGNDIVDGENIHEVWEKLDRELKSYESKQANLEAKIDGSKYKIERQDELLNEIEKAYSDADDYLRLFKLQNQEIEEKNSLVQEYKQRIHRQDIIRKKMESDQQTNLQKYHQLLKLFELQTGKEEKLDKRLIEGDIKILKASNIILDLEKELEQLEDISQRFNEQVNLKKEAELLRNAVERNEAFMTENGFALTSNSINSHMVGVRSIIEENESDIRETIQNQNVDDKETIHTTGNTTANNVRVKSISKGRMMFTKIQTSHQPVTNMKKESVTSKQIPHQPQSFTDGKYYLSSKEISKKRQEQKNITTLRKQSSTNDNRNAGRKVYSLIKPNDTAKLKELSMNRTNKEIKEIKIPNIKGERRQVNMPHTAKQPYLSVNRMNEKQKEGKQSLRERKSSLKIVSKAEEGQNQQAKKNLLQELEEINRQMQVNATQSSNIRSQKNTIDLSTPQTSSLLQTLQKTKPIFEKQQQKQKHQTITRVSQDLPNRAQLSGKIVKPSSKEGPLRKSDSKEGKIKHQPAIKPEVLEEIDKRNIQYSKKIEEMKQQLMEKEGKGNEKSKKNVDQDMKVAVNEQMETIKDPEKEKINPPQKADTSQQVLMPEVSIITHQQKDAQQNDYSDDDIEQDLSEINRMIKQKLQDQGIKAE